MKSPKIKKKIGRPLAEPKYCACGCGFIFDNLTDLRKHLRITNYENKKRI